MTLGGLVLVTGASGFVGGHLLPALAGMRVRLALRAESANRLPGFEPVVVGDLDRSTEWTPALADVQTVVHMAAHVHVMKPTADDRQRFYEVNALGTERLAIAAAECGVKRFIFLSSIKVNGESTTDRPFNAMDAPHPEDDYGLSKCEGEQRLFRVAARTGMSVVVLRPTLVYGIGVRGNFLKLMSWVSKGVPLPFGSIANARSILSVWNLCDLVVRVVQAREVASGVFLVSDGVELSTPELIRRIAGAMRRPARLLPVPAQLLKLAGAMTSIGPSIQRLCSSLTVDIALTREAFDWTPAVPVDEALDRTAQWYLSGFERPTLG
jgi:nucleoside-diphosphate-sugar epimerase